MNSRANPAKLWMNFWRPNPEQGTQYHEGRGENPAPLVRLMCFLWAVYLPQPPTRLDLWEKPQFHTLG